MDTQPLVNVLVGLDDETVLRVLSEALQRRPELAPGVVTKAVPDLTYAPADAMSKRRATGMIKSFTPTGFGFIACPELRAVFGHDVYVHKNQIANFQQGEEVSFAVLLSKDMKPQAFDLQSLSGGKGGPMGGCGGCCGGPIGGGALGGGMMDGCWGGKGYKGYGKGCCKGKSGDMWGSPFGDGSFKGFDDKGKGKKGPKVLSENAKPDVQQVLGQFVGVIKTFNSKNGFGFIECPQLKEQGFDRDVYLHHAQIGSFQPGMQVTFTAYLNKRGQPQSMDLAPIA